MYILSLVSVVRSALASGGWSTINCVVRSSRQVS
jgi:hypothetical protein